MGSLSPFHTDLISLAKEQLNISLNVSEPHIPKSYLDELKIHLSLYPHDTNFRVTLEPHRGDGIVECLEQGCEDVRIKLSARPKGSDGGIKEIFGSLLAYRVHISTHATHKKARRARIAAQQRVPRAERKVYTPTAAVTGSNTRRADKPSSFLDYSIGSPDPLRVKTPTVPRTLTHSRSADRSAVKAESTESSIPRKRHSDSFNHDTVKVEDRRMTIHDFIPLPSWKKPKLEAPKTPLTQHNPNTGLLHDMHQDIKPVVPVTHSSRTPVASDSNIQLPSTSQRPRALPSSKHVMEGIPPAGSSSNLPSHIPICDRNMGTVDDSDDDTYDADGDWHGRGKDTFVGPVAGHDEINQFLLDAGAEQFDGNASVDKALEKLGLDAQFKALPGMEISLMPHQTIGVAWMMEKEKGPNKGGLLADEMGLGKTVQMISIVVTNQSDDPRCKTNLIIAPTALLDQWKSEIEMKTNCDLKCLIYHGSNKPRKKQDLMKYDVVLTTYATMALEWPDFEAEEKAKNKKTKTKRKPKDDFIESDSEDDIQTKKKRKPKEAGLLFQIYWYRVILDEAQNIRNRGTRNSRSVTDLKAKYRWCLSGTPITNSLSDMYGIVRFLRIRPWYDWVEYNGHVARLEKKNPELATTRLQAIMGPFVLRRKKNSMLDGKRLIELPPKQVTLFKLEFSEEERDIYKMVEARSQATFNRYLRAGTVLKNYAQVLVLLLRLRQICSHAALIQEGASAFISPDEVDENVKPGARAELSRAAQLVSPEFVARMKFKLKQSIINRIEAEKKSVDATVEDEECPICFDALADPVVTPCTHIFCRECLVDVINSPYVDDVDGHQYKANERPCPVCRTAVCAQKMFSRAAFEPTDADLAGADERYAITIEDSDEEMPDISATSQRRIRGKTIRKKHAIVKSDDDYDDDDMSDFIVEDNEDEEEKDARHSRKKRLGKRRAMVLESEDEDEDLAAEVVFGAKPKVQNPVQVKMMSRFLPSTKMKHMMDTLHNWAKENPGEKTLIISQWTQCLQLVSDYLTEEGIIHVKYQGDMNRNKRDQAVRIFMSKDKAQVMLMSLKCGGVGLNLCRANRVISLDLAWSEAVESQAFDRVHRLGQTRTVSVQRLVIANTVEDRVLALQERKKNLADGSLGEGTGKKIGRLSVRELANLFGLDHRGRVLNN